MFVSNALGRGGGPWLFDPGGTGGTALYIYKVYIDIKQTLYLGACLKHERVK